MKSISDFSKDIKSKVSFRDIFQELFPDNFNAHGNSLCPFHEDHTPSFQINDRFGFCHGGCSQQNYDVIDLWSRKYNVGKAVAIQELAEKYSVRSEALSKLQKQPSSGRKQTEAYDYCNENGEILFQVVRYEPKDFKQRRPGDKEGSWEWKHVSRVRRVLYRFPELLRSTDDTVYFCEGEKDVHTVEDLGLAATTSAGGSNAWGAYAKDPRSTSPLASKHVVILADNDDSGGKYAIKVAKTLQQIAASVKIVNLPGLPPGGDVTDFIRSRGPDQGKTDLLQLVTNTEVTGIAIEDTRSNWYMELIRLLQEEMQLEIFEDQFGNLWAPEGKPGAGVINVPALSHRCYRSYMGKLVDALQRDVRKDSWDSACYYLASKSNDRRDLYVRFAKADDRFLIDSGWDDGSVFEIRPDTGTWSIVSPRKSVFKRFSQTSLPRPGTSGSVFDIFNFVPIKDDDTRILIAVWLVGSLVPDIDHPGIMMHGLQGAGKTVACRMLKSLIDPSRTMSMALSKDEPEMIQAMSHHALSCFDNIHSLPQWASDCMCRGITGLGSQKRKLHTDDEDFEYEFRSTFVLNCISVPPHSPDLSDRSFLIEIPRLSESARRPLGDIMKDFEDSTPSIFGAMLDAFAAAARIFPSIVLEGYPRLADWTRWGCAIAEALGIGQDKFLNAFSASRKAQHFDIINAAPICLAVKHLLLLADPGHNEGQYFKGTDAKLFNQGHFKGTSSQLFKLLSTEEFFEAAGVNPNDGRSGWPKNASALARILKKYSDNLRETGIDVGFPPRSGQSRSITISPV